MTREEIITGLKFTVVNCLLDPDKLETFTEPISFADKITVDACIGAIKLLEQEPNTWNLDNAREDMKKYVPTILDCDKEREDK